MKIGEGAPVGLGRAMQAGGVPIIERRLEEAPTQQPVERPPRQTASQAGYDRPASEVAAEGRGDVGRQELRLALEGVVERTPTVSTAGGFSGERARGGPLVRFRAVHETHIVNRHQQNVNIVRIVDGTQTFTTVGLQQYLRDPQYSRPNLIAFAEGVPRDFFQRGPGACESDKSEFR